MAKMINGHVYKSFYQGVNVFVVDEKVCYDVTTAAKWLGITVEEFKKIW